MQSSRVLKQNGDVPEFAIHLAHVLLVCFCALQVAYPAAVLASDDIRDRIAETWLGESERLRQYVETTDASIKGSFAARDTILKGVTRPADLKIIDPRDVAYREQVHTDALYFAEMLSSAWAPRLHEYFEYHHFVLARLVQELRRQTRFDLWQWQSPFIYVAFGVIALEGETRAVNSMIGCIDRNAKRFIEIESIKLVTAQINYLASLSREEDLNRKALATRGEAARALVRGAQAKASKAREVAFDQFRDAESAHQATLQKALRETQAQCLREEIKNILEAKELTIEEFRKKHDEDMAQEGDIAECGERLGRAIADLEAQVDLQQRELERAKRRAQIRFRALANLMFLEKEVEIRWLRWMSATGKIGSAYEVARNNHLSALKDRNKEIALADAEMFAVLTAATAGSMSWLSTIVQTSSSGSKNMIRRVLTNGLEDAMQSGFGEAIDVVQQSVLPVVDSAGVEGPVSFQNALMDGLHQGLLEAKQYFAEFFKAAERQPECSWESFDLARQQRAHTNWLKRTYVFRDNPKLATRIAEKLETAMWARWIKQLEVTRQTDQLNPLRPIIGDAVRARLVALGLRKDAGLFTSETLPFSIELDVERIVAWARGFKPEDVVESEIEGTSR